jgi:hypothetical protein
MLVMLFRRSLATIMSQILDMIVASATFPGDTGYTGPILQATLDGLRPPADAKPA